MYRMVCICVLLLTLATAGWADEMVSLKAGYQVLEPSGTLAGNKGSIGAHLDVENDLNLDDSEEVTAEAAFQLGAVRLSLGYLPINYAGTGKLTVSGTYNGQTLTANDVVSTDVQLDIYDLGLTLNLVNIDDGPLRFQLGPELAVKLVDAEVKLVNETANYTEQESATVPIPTLGARARIGLSDFVSLVGRVGYLEYDQNSFLDAEAQIEFSPLPMVGVYAGYRTFELEIDESDLFVDLEFSGPFVGALVRF